MASNIIDVVAQKLEDVIELQGNHPVLNTNFSRMEGWLIVIRNKFQSRQKKLPEPVERCLERIKYALGEAKDLIDAAKRERGPGRQRDREPGRQRGWYPSCCDLFSQPDLSSNPDLSSKSARVWEARFGALTEEFEMFFLMSANTEQIVSSGLLQPVLDESGFVGSGFQSTRKQLQSWLADPSREARVIGVWGPGGIGKTSLLKSIYNTYRKEVSRFFDVVIWFTVSGIFVNEQLQGSIAEALNLSLEGISDVETRKSKLNASLERKKFLLILDNVQSEINLNEVGVKIGDDNGSRLLISSRSKEVIEAKGAKDYSLDIKRLSSEEGWILFRNGAFANEDVPQNIEPIARQMASRCKGLPLAINTVAAAMKFKKISEDQWTRASDLMSQTDASTDRAIEAGSSRNRRSIDAELYRLLRWSYNELSDPHLKNCFLNCAAFLEDKEILLETLVEMWVAEGLLNWKEIPSSLMDAGRHCINALVSRRLVECVEYFVDDDYHSVEYLKIHEVFFDMAIDIGQREEKCLFAGGQQLKEFHGERETRDCKRISVAHNAIRTLPADLKCKELQSLVLASNLHLEEVPKGFFSNVTALKVLDLSCTSIRTLPTSMGQLPQLRFLNLSSCSKLVGLPNKMGELVFLNLTGCSSLVDLPSDIGELKNLKHLKLDACYSLMGIPSNLLQLSALNTLTLPLMESTFALSVENLTSFSHLMELSTVVKAKTNVDCTMDAWLEMRSLTLEFEDDPDAERDVEVPQHVILQNMGNMKKLQSFRLINYQGLTLPDSICKFQNMKILYLRSCYQLKALPALEGNSFPMLEKLVLKNLLKLESIAGSSGMWNAGTMTNLQLLVIINCPLLKKLPEGIELHHLRELHITMCNELTELDIGSGSFPMLEMLTLDELNKLKSIAGSSGMWNERTMSNLQNLEFIDCPLLRTLPRGMDKLSCLKQINGEVDWWQRIKWEDDKMRTSLSRLFMMI